MRLKDLTPQITSRLVPVGSRGRLICVRSVSCHAEAWELMCHCVQGPTASIWGPAVGQPRTWARQPPGSQGVSVSWVQRLLPAGLVSSDPHVNANLDPVASQRWAVSSLQAMKGLGDHWLWTW